MGGTENGGTFIWSLPCAEQAGRPGRVFAVHGVQHAYRSDLARGRKRSDVSPPAPRRDPDLLR